MWTKGAGARMWRRDEQEGLGLWEGAVRHDMLDTLFGNACAHIIVDGRFWSCGSLGSCTRDLGVVVAGRVLQVSYRVVTAEGALYRIPYYEEQITVSSR